MAHSIAHCPHHPEVSVRAIDHCPKCKVSTMPITDQQPRRRWKTKDGEPDLIECRLDDPASLDAFMSWFDESAEHYKAGDWNKRFQVAFENALAARQPARGSRE